MEIKSIKSFRFWYKTKVKGIDKNDHNYNENFLGTYYNSNGKRIKGFFEMYHGDKPNIRSYLPSLLKIAEDGQAIYEFLQNAVDCESTHFYLFYNENYFLAINNGEPFDLNGLQSILNIAQSTKKSCDKIGRFGIGFKLVHRLVGKGEGTEEIIKEYKGPIIFSWSKVEHIGMVLQKQDIQPIFPSKDTNKKARFDEAPYLFKILLTNFPTEPNEIVKNLEYKDTVLFSREEFNEFADFLKYCLEKYPNEIKYKDLQHGTMFFIKLGKGKKELLDRDYEDFKQGVEYSMNMLKKLQKVIINETIIVKQNICLEHFSIKKNSQEFDRIEPEYKECDINITIGYYPNYKEGIKLKEAPNFYKYFPLGDETNGFSFIVHCDSFSNEANRRKLQKDSTNKNLLPEIAKLITKRLEEYKTTNREQFLRFYASLILSDTPDKQNNEWLKSIFYDILLNYLRRNIPTQNNQFGSSPEYVKIKDLTFSLNLSDWGLGHIQWFEWEETNDKDLVREAKKTNKLNLKSWSFADVLRNCDIEVTNKFLTQNYIINSNFQSIILENFSKISDFEWSTKNAELFVKFSNLYFFHYYREGKLFIASLNQCLQGGIIILQSKHAQVKDILQKISLTISEQFVDRELSPIGKIICENVPYIKDERKLFQIIAEKINQNASLLLPNEKKSLFEFLQELQGVGKETLKELKLFRNVRNEILPLNILVCSDQNLPKWLEIIKIKQEENFPSLKKYLLAEEDIFSQIIINNWEQILYNIPSNTQIEQFYKEVLYYYSLKENNPVLKAQKFVFVQYYNTFVEPQSVFYNKNLSKISDYESLRSGIEKLTGKLIPLKNIFQYFYAPPFELKDSDITDFIQEQTSTLHLDELKAILEFCKINRENFFESFVIEKHNKWYRIYRKSKNIFQVIATKKEAKEFIEVNLKTYLKILPSEIDEYKNESIIDGEKLYNLIVDLADIDSYKEKLVDIITYEKPKRKFLLKLSELRIFADERLNKESFEYKILEMACNNLKDEKDIKKFRDKIVVETNEGELNLTDITSFIDKIKIEDCELSLSKILPDNYKNTDILNELIENLLNIGINQDKLNTLLGIDTEPELEEVFETLSQQIDVLENAEQLAFVLLYNKHIDRVDLGAFKVLCKGGGEYNLTYNFYVKEFNFLVKDAALDEKYKNIKKILNDLPFEITSDNLILEEPFFTDEKFICPDLDTEMSDEQKLSFIEFLYHQWHKKNKKTIIRNIDWSSIENIETERLLGFNPKYSVYPSKYALESEKLPEYLQEWLSEDENKIRFIADLGVFTEYSTIVELRKFFNNEGTFKKSKIVQDSRLSDEKMLFNTFEWLKENEIELNRVEEFEVFEEIVRIINLNRTNGELIIQEEYDFEILERQSIEWDNPYYQSWKEKLENKYSIFLFDGELPKVIMLDEIDDYIFYRLNQGNIAIDNENRIFINRNTDIKKALSLLISDDNNDFSAEELLLLYQVQDQESENNEITKLKEENERLRKLIQEMTSFSGRASYDATTSYDDEYHQQIKEKSEKYLYKVLKEKYPTPKYKVIWLNEAQESWQNHDFQIRDKNGNILHYIDCKGTPQNKRTFYLTSNEWNFFIDCIQREKNYQIYRILNVETFPSYVHIDDLWKWIKEGKVVPYLEATETIKGGRVFLTLKEI